MLSNNNLIVMILLKCDILKIKVKIYNSYCNIFFLIYNLN